MNRTRINLALTLAQWLGRARSLGPLRAFARQMRSKSLSLLPKQLKSPRRGKADTVLGFNARFVIISH